MIRINAYCAPLDRGKALRDAVAAARPGDRLTVPVGTYDLGADPLLLPAQVTLAGEGRDRTILQSSYLFTIDQPSAFVLDSLSVVEDLTLQSTCKINEQSTVVGFGKADQARSAILRRCVVLGRAWGVYTWLGPDGNQLELFDCDVISGRQCISACRSSGPQAQFVDLYRCRLFVRPGLSTYVGAVSNKTYGGSLAIVCRGGRVRAWDCYAEVAGSPVMPRACAVTDWYDDGSQNSQIELYNLHARVTGNGATEVFDVDCRKVSPLVGGGTGSGPGGRFLSNPIRQVQWASGV